MIGQSQPEFPPLPPSTSSKLPGSPRASGHFEIDLSITKTTRPLTAATGLASM